MRKNILAGWVHAITFSLRVEFEIDLESFNSGSGSPYFSKESPVYFSSEGKKKKTISIVMNVLVFILIQKYKIHIKDFFVCYHINICVTFHTIISDTTGVTTDQTEISNYTKIKESRRKKEKKENSIF